MGQPIDEPMRRRITALPHVAEVTEQHIVLHSGTVLDPSEFVVNRTPMRFVCKLLQCGCWFTNHHPGTHVIVAGVIEEFADHQQKRRFDWPRFCPKGRWTMEEALPLIRVKSWRASERMQPPSRIPHESSFGRVRLTPPNGNGMGNRTS